MAELFIELFSEEIPSKLQINAREKIKLLLEEKLKSKSITFKSSKSFSTPKRLVFVIDGIPKKIEEKGKIIKGPKISAPATALEGFIKSNNLKKEDIYKNKIEKGEFYFANTKKKIVDISFEFKFLIPDTIKSFKWKKSMKWSNYDLNWGRPLRSIIALFDNKLVNFDFFHLKSSHLTYIEDTLGEKQKKVKNFASYLNILKTQSIVLDQEERKKIIIKKFNNFCSLKKYKNNFNEKLVEEVVNLVEKPNVIVGKFDEIYLKVPKEILIITMQQHQKYFPIFNEKNELTNLFLLVANLSDVKGYIKIGNQRVVEARLSDAKFFWEKNKTQNLVKQVSKLKELIFFKKLGSFYDKTQRLRKLASIISDQLNINKEKTEIAASICKVDLISDLVGEFPELQGVMGKYFASEQGFEEDVSIAIRDHYFPIGQSGKVSKKVIGSAVGLADKIDTLVGFFGINEKPSSSKDPFALRRTAIGILRIIIENKLTVQLKDLINYSIVTYKEQKVQLSNDLVSKEVLLFLKERFKNLLRDKKIRNDIIESAYSSNTNDDFSELYKKCVILNKNISSALCKDIITTYKRASNIIDKESKNEKIKILDLPESALFTKDEEKYLYENINMIQKYFLDVKKKESYQESLKILLGAKPAMDNFFKNVVVNDENLAIKKNRLDLLRMFCTTCNNFTDFSKIEGV